MRVVLALGAALAAAPAPAQEVATECDRLAGFDHTPRRDGLPGVYAIADPAAAIAACEAALAAPGADPFLNFLLLRALLLADPQDPRLPALAEAGRPASASMADSRLGLLYDDGLGGLPQDRAQALALYTVACAAWPDRMARAGCNNQARSQIEDFPQARTEGFALMERMCQADLGVSCKNLGTYLRDGEVAEPDLPRALAYFDRACALGDGEGCGWAGYMREKGEGTDPDPAAAFPLYVRACDLGDAWSCYAQGENLSLGLGVAADIDAAIPLLRRACDGGEAQGCARLAELTEAADPAGAAAARARACELGHDPACPAE